MVEIAKRHQDSLERIKKNIEKSSEYFKDNYDRFHEFRKFIYITSVSEEDKALLKSLKKPPLEVNVLEAYLSRLCGEFSKQQPSIEVKASEGVNIDTNIVDIVEAHMKYIEADARANGSALEIYKDLLSGGFSVSKIWTEYVHTMSFDQIIKSGRVYDPTLCGFDPLARMPGKGDGRYCFEMYPKTKDEFQEEFPNVNIENIKFTRTALFDGLSSFNWSYRTQKEDIILVVDYYEKKLRRVKIVKLSDGQIMTNDDYEDFIGNWQMSGNIMQPPVIVGKPRMTELVTIVRYRLIEDQVIEHTETDFEMLPLVFISGNSVIIKDHARGSIQEYTRPYIYHAKDVQKLKNFAAQSLANELENSVQHKFKVPKEGIPPEYLDAYTNVQEASVLIYNQFKDNNPQVRLDPPQEIARPPIPQDFTNTLMMSDQVIQNILGSYDASLGINQNQLSGIAIVEAATQSNAAAMPYVIGYLQGLTKVAEVIMHLLPKYYATPRTLPVIDKDGKKGFVNINQPGDIHLNYKSSDLKIDVEAGVNFAIQKSRALQQIIALMQASPIFAQFINQEGLEVLIDNLEIRGVDRLKNMSTKFMQELEQAKQRAQQQPQQDPQVLRAKNEQVKISQEAQQNQVDNKLKAAELAIDKQDSDNDRLRLLVGMSEGEQDRQVQREKQETERAGRAVDLAIKTTDMHHRHRMDLGSAIQKRLKRI